MGEWWSYRPGDFLMFAPRTYWRLVAQYNRELWPWHWLATAAAVALAWLALRPSRAAARATWIVLAGAWGWVAWGFHWERYATINWGAGALAVAAAAQAALLAAWALRPDPARPQPGRGAARAGVLLIAAGAAVYPLASAAAGAAWARAELFGLMPEPTALVTAGALVAHQPRQWGWLAVVPAVSLVVGFWTVWLLVSR